MIQALGDNAMTAQVKVWHKCFKDGQESIDSEPHSRRPTTSSTTENVERIWAAINKDRWLTVWELEADLELQKLLCMRFWSRILARNVSWQNSFHCLCYKSRRNIVLQLLMTWFIPLPMNRFPQGHDQRWIMIWTQRPSRPNGSHLVLHVWRSHSKVAAKSRPMLTVFFDWGGVVHHEYTPLGHAINKEYCLDVLH